MISHTWVLIRATLGATENGTQLVRGGIRGDIGGSITAGKHSKGNRQAAKANARAAGLGGSAGAFLAFGLSPQLGAPTAKADVFDDILDLAIGSARSSAITTVNPTDFLNPAVLPGLAAWARTLAATPLAPAATGSVCV